MDPPSEFSKGSTARSAVHCSVASNALELLARARVALGVRGERRRLAVRAGHALVRHAEPSSPRRRRRADAEAATGTLGRRPPAAAAFATTAPTQSPATPLPGDEPGAPEGARGGGGVPERLGDDDVPGCGAGRRAEGASARGRGRGGEHDATARRSPARRVPAPRATRDAPCRATREGRGAASARGRTSREPTSARPCAEWRETTARSPSRRDSHHSRVTSIRMMISLTSPIVLARSIVGGESVHSPRPRDPGFLFRLRFP